MLPSQWRAAKRDRGSVEAERWSAIGANQDFKKSLILPTAWAARHGASLSRLAATGSAASLWRACARERARRGAKENY